LRDVRAWIVILPLMTACMQNIRLQEIIAAHSACPSSRTLPEITIGLQNRSASDCGRSHLVEGKSDAPPACV